MNFVPLVDRLPPFLQAMMDRAMERPIHYERPANRRRILPSPFDGYVPPPPTPEKKPGPRARMD